MCRFLDKLRGVEKASAQIVDGVLVLSLPDALTPQLWRLDLEKAQNTALEVWDGDGGTFVLGQKTAKNTKTEIAAFADRDKAVYALMVAARAMASAPSRTTAATGAGGETVLVAANKRQGGKFGTVLIGFVLLLLLIVLFMNAGGQPPVNYSGEGGQMPVDGGGAPMSADEFLMNR